MAAVGVVAAGEEVDHYQILGLPSDGWKRLNLSSLQVKAAFNSTAAQIRSSDAPAALEQLKASKTHVLGEVLRQFHIRERSFARFKREREVALIRDRRLSPHREDEEDGEERGLRLWDEFERMRAAEYAAAHPEPALTVGEGSSGVSVS